MFQIIILYAMKKVISSHLNNLQNYLNNNLYNLQKTYNLRNSFIPSLKKIYEWL